MPRRSPLPCSRSRAPLLALLTLLVLLAGGVAPAAAHGPSDLAAISPEQLRGLTVAGAGGCAGGYRVTGTGFCTHGPDARPAGGRLTVQPPTAASAIDAPLPAAVICDGDGTSGKRVQAVYARLAGTPSRRATVLPQIRTAAAGVQSAFLVSAARTDGVRRPRWATNPDCSLSIVEVTLSDAARSSFNATITELGALGLARADRKYLVWWDTSVYCGIGTFWGDDRPTPDNLSNTHTGYARVDAGCWGWAEPHELMHTLGAVQNTAPHSTYGVAPGAFAHCTDEYDVMCYPDASGVTMTIVCPDHALDGQFDCGNDDYFDTSPAAGSYLGTHWNTADSDWLAHTVVALSDPTPGLATGAVVVAGRLPLTVPLASRAPLAGVEIIEAQRQDGDAAWQPVTVTGDGSAVATRVAAGRSVRFRVRSLDSGGAPAAWLTGRPVVARTVGDGQQPIRYHGRWRTIADRTALGGALHRANTDGATATIVTTADELGIVAPVGPDAGRLEVRLDGHLRRVIDLAAPEAAARTVVAAIELGGGRHTVVLRVRAPHTATPGWHVDLDAIALLTR